MTTEKDETTATTAAAAVVAKTAPIAPEAMCDVPGCGMPATGSANRLNHCTQAHHEAWTESRHANQIRALKGL